MRKLIFILHMLFLSSLSSPTVWAEMSTFTVAPQGIGGDAPATFSLKYSLGTHHGLAPVTGKWQWDGAAAEKARGEFKVDLKRITTHNATRDCHMQEALGLDYARSRFPEEHVCNSEDLIAGDDQDAFVYPEVQFQLQGLKVLSHQAGEQQVWQVQVQGVWKIHGVEKSFVQKGELRQKSAEQMLFMAHFPLRLSDFKIIVKPARILGISVGVNDTTQVHLAMVLNRI